MKFFARCFGVFATCWILFIVGGNTFLDTAHVMPKSILFGGIISIFMTVLYGWFDEAWIQHGRSRSRKA